MAACLLPALSSVWRYEQGIRLITAIKSGDSRAAMAAIRLGADPEAQSYTEFWSPLDAIYHGIRGEPYRRFSLSALMLAAIAGQTEVVDELIRRGANVNETNTNDLNPIAYAEKYRHPEVVRLLREHGARPPQL